jgi:hypothetical protein
MKARGLILPMSGTAFISRQRFRQRSSRRSRAKIEQTRFRFDRDLRHGKALAGSRLDVRNGFQSQRRSPEHRRLHQTRRNFLDHQHAARANFALRRTGDSQGRAAIQRAVRDDDDRRGSSDRSDCDEKIAGERNCRRSLQEIQKKSLQEIHMIKTIFKSFIVFCFSHVAVSIFAQRDLGVRPTDSGGVLMPEQAAYDVKHYDLAICASIRRNNQSKAF